MAKRFQYISCCYLSFLALYLPISQVCFNTSHVVIYPPWSPDLGVVSIVSIHLMLLFIWLLVYPIGQESMFQYISCCYLSNQFRIQISTIFKFQYISCCYLSSTLITEISRKCSFNTSHVVIYPDGETLVIIGSSFNTSHVVIYLW